MSERIDHKLVVAASKWPNKPGKQPMDQTRGHCKQAIIAKERLNDPSAVCAFQAFILDQLAMAGAADLQDADPDVVFDVVTKIMLEGQKHYLTAGVPPGHEPRKPWTSKSTAALASSTPSLRKSLGESRKSLRHASLRATFLVWRSHVHAPVCSLYSAQCRYAVWRARLGEAAALLDLRQHRTRVSHEIRNDLNGFLKIIADKANSDAARFDWSSLYKTARKLHSPQDRPHDAVFDVTEESTITEPSLIKQRWQRHWQDLFRADIISFGTLVARTTDRQNLSFDRIPDAALEEVEQIIAAADPRKATGPDNVAIATWQVGGTPAAIAMQYVENSARRAGRAASAMKGGRIQNVWKGNEDKRRPQASRGLLIQPFAGKVHGTFLKQRLAAPYLQAVADVQCGAVPGRGYVVASAAVNLHSDHARSLRTSWAHLFVDLSAAFDTVIRELAMCDVDVPSDAILHLAENTASRPKSRTASCAWLMARTPVPSFTQGLHRLTWPC